MWASCEAQNLLLRLMVMFTYFRRIPIARTHVMNRALDLTLVWIATMVATRAQDIRVTLLLGVTASAMWLFASRVVQQYQTGTGRGFYGDIALTLWMFAMVLVPLWSIAELLSRPAPVTNLTALLVPSAFLVRMLLVSMRLRHNEPTESVLVVGAGALGRLTGNEIAAGDRQLLGHLLFEDEADVAVSRLRAPVIGSVTDLEEILKEHVVDEVYFASTAGEHSASP